MTATQYTKHNFSDRVLKRFEQVRFYKQSVSSDPNLPIAAAQDTSAAVH